MNKILKRKSGQALTEYIILVSFIAIASYGMVRLFGKFIQLTFRQHVLSLGYEVPVESRSIALNKELVMFQMKTHEIRNEIGNYYANRQ